MSSTRRRRRNSAERKTDEEVDPPTCTELRDTIKETTEMGYFLLSECTVYLNSATRNFPRKKWIGVEILEGAEAPIHNSNGHQHECLHCNLMFHEQLEEETIIMEDAPHRFQYGPVPCPQIPFANLAKFKSSNLGDHLEGYGSSSDEYNSDKEKEDDKGKISAKLFLQTNRVARFQGTMADQICRASCPEQKRSDAALLLGAILEAQDHGYVSLQSLKILLHEQAQNKNQEDGQNITSAKASLMATLSFPSLAANSLPTNIKRSKREPASLLRSIVPASRRNNNNAIKPLPQSMQLLLSMIRSDWTNLDHRMRELTTEGYVKKNKKADYFPPKLSLEELYIRIRGSNSKGCRQEETMPQQLTPALSGLPLEILKAKITPFLRAKSMDALRCTCKGFHKNLESVVPGLDLRLFQHQIKSLQWMRQREIRPISEAKGQEMIQSGMLSADDDNDPVRAMTGGQSVWLCPRSQQKGLRIHQMTGCEMPVEQGEVLARQGARGGLLCDDPGLGKTITVLALILQTVGLSTEQRAQLPHQNPNQDQNPEEQMFQAYWKEDITFEYRRSELCRLMARLKRLDAAVDIFFPPIDPERDGCEDYFDVIKHPICLKDIHRKISAAEYGTENSDFSAFVGDVELCFRNAMEYNPPTHEVHQAAGNLLGRFREELLVQFKKDLLGSLRSSASNSSLKPNSLVAALMQRKAEHEFQQSLVQSSSTLIVIPHVLTDHWMEQIQTHVNFRYATSQIPLIYEYTPKRKSALGLEEALRLCKVDKSHFPLVFVDKAGTEKLPSADFLAMFMIVITTTKRFTNEWKNGSFQEELAQNRDDGAKHVNYRLMEYGKNDDEACPLLKVNWLRMIVDEGHSMSKGKGNSAIRFASWISAQRRWAMTGTPTQQTASQNGLKNMQGLLQFLQHDFFDRRKDGDKVWKSSVARSWAEGNLASFFRLKSLLSLLMIRHTKLDIAELALPIRNTTLVQMSTVEITAYNTLSSVVQSNLKLTSMQGKTSGQQDSLLNKAQAKHAQLALTNIRRVCCGGSRIVPVVTSENWVEFIQLCRFEHEMQEDTVGDMMNYLQEVTTERLSRCHCCGILLSMLLVSPCGCLLCTQCFDNSCNICVMCDKPFDVDDFQRLQPGMDFKWVQTDEHIDGSKKDKGPKVEANAAAAGSNGNNVNARNEVVENVVGNIPLQVGENVVALGDAAQNRVLIRPPQERRRTRKPGDGHVCEYSPSFKGDVAGKCILCWAEHDHCKLVNPASCCPVCFVKAEDCPESESKAHYLVSKLLKLYEKQQQRERDFTPTAGFGRSLNWRPMKVIVFSQFRGTLDMVGNRLLRKFGSACVAEYWGKYRTAELHKFVHDPDCFAMLLGKDGSEGLDLSFVTHLYFLEAIWDKSLEQQAVARAWRMGATGPVQVETLLAKNSVEEQVNQLEELMNSTAPSASEGGDSNAPTKQDNSRQGQQRGKVQFLLKSLKLMPDIEIVPLPLQEQVQKRFGFDAKALNCSEQAGDRQKVIQTWHAFYTDEEDPPAKKRRLMKRCVRFGELEYDMIL